MRPLSCFVPSTGSTPFSSLTTRSSLTSSHDGSARSVDLLAMASTVTTTMPITTITTRVAVARWAVAERRAVETDEVIVRMSSADWIVHSTEMALPGATLGEVTSRRATIDCRRWRSRSRAATRMKRPCKAMAADWATMRSSRSDGRSSMMKPSTRIRESLERPRCWTSGKIWSLFASQGRSIRRRYAQKSVLFSK